MKKMENTYRYRQIARVTFEITTPLAVGSGNKDITTDSVVMKDVNELPYIPGTTLAGLIRHSLSVDTQNKLMGWQKKKEGQGSRLIVSEAKILSAEGKPIDGLSSCEDTVTKLCKELPIRQHVRINQQGTAVKNGKFDEEIVPKGLRFCFEMEIMDDNDCSEDMNAILAIIQTDDFRIGSGTRSGFGQIKVISILRRGLDLNDPTDLELYLEKLSSLAKQWKGFELFPVESLTSANYVRYELRLQPTDFMLFGSGFGDDRSDMTYVREPIIEWKDGKAVCAEREKIILIPATSVKGALAHRTAYHYNKLNNRFADTKTVEELEEYIGKGNEAVKALFGSEGNSKGEDKQRGEILFSDVIIKNEETLEGKVLNHVKIDRFTGGAVEGALFSEEVLYVPNQNINLELRLHKFETEDKNIIPAFESALKDICKGYLPLGGGVNRGNGTFKGSLIKEGDTIYDNDK